MGTSKLLGKPIKLWGVTCDGLASRPGGVEILVATSCHRNRDKLRQPRASQLQGFTYFRAVKLNSVYQCKGNHDPVIDADSMSKSLHQDSFSHAHKF